MKKIIIVLSVIVSLLLFAAILLPVFFKDTIRRHLQMIIEENVDAHVYFDADKFGLTLFKNFPNPTATIGDFGIIGKEPFEGDTLISAESFHITINLFSLFGDNFRIRSIFLDRPVINVLIDETGAANYEIIKEEEDSVAEDTTASAFSLSIEHWAVRDGRIRYRDKTMDFEMFFDGFNHHGGGNITADVFDLGTYTAIDRTFVEYENTAYLAGQKIVADINLNMNMKDWVFTFLDNEIRVNDFPLSFDGSVAMPGDDINMDISFASENASVKGLYSLIPAVFTEEYEGINAEGTLSFSGFVKGVYNDDSMPAYELKLNAENGMIAYPDLSKPIRNINLDMLVATKDGNYENTMVDIRKMHFEMGGNPVDGSLLIKNLHDYDMKADLKARLNLAELNTIFPIEGLEMKGLFAIDLKAEGVYDSVRKIMPAIDASMSMKGGYIKSTEFPKALENMSFHSNFTSPTGKMEDAQLKVKDFKMAMQGRALTADLLLKDFVNYTWDLKVAGDLDLEVLSQVYPIEGMEYSGLLTTDIETSGQYADVEAERYDRLSTTGLVELKDFSYRDNDTPQGVRIRESKVTLTPKEIKIHSFDGNLGRSDISVNGYLTNYLDYIFRDDALLKGKMQLRSNLLDLNEWMTSEEATDTGEDTVELEAVAIPRNIDFEFDSEIKTIYYDNLTLNNARGMLVLRDGVLDMSDLSFGLLGGAIVMNGVYDTRNPDKPSFAYNLNIKSLSIPDAFTSFTTVQTFAPFAGQMNGKFSSKFTLSGKLKKDLTPVYSSLNGEGLIQISEAFVKESQLVEGIAGFMKSGIDTKQLTLRDVIIKASLEDGRAHVSPFQVYLGQQKAQISGSIGADGTLDYLVNTEIEVGEVGRKVNELIGNLTGDTTRASSSKIKLNIRVGGTYDNPKFSLAGTSSEQTGQGGQTGGLKEETTEKVQEVAETETEKLIDQTKEQIQPEVDSLKKNLKKNIKGELGDMLEDELDSAAGEIGNVLKNLFKKKKKN